jgi:hypothetical protein
MKPNAISPMERAKRLGNLAWRFVDLAGQRFGRLLGLHRDGKDIGGHIRWHAQCGCGLRTVVDGTSLRLGRTGSCGCVMNERRRARGRANRLQRLGFRRATQIHDALEKEIGADRLDRILSKVRLTNKTEERDPTKKINEL